MLASVQMSSLESTESVRNVHLEPAMILFHSVALRIVEKMKFTQLYQSDAFVHKAFSGLMQSAKPVLQDLITTPLINNVFLSAPTTNFITPSQRNVSAKADST